MTITYYLGGGQAPVVEDTSPCRANSRYTVTVHDAARGRRARPGGQRPGRDEPGRRHRRRAADVLPLRRLASAASPAATTSWARPAPRTAWYFPDGNTDAGCDEYLTLMNPTGRRPPRAPDLLRRRRGDAARSRTITVAGQQPRHRRRPRDGRGRRPRHDGTGPRSRPPTASRSSSSGRCTSATAPGINGGARRDGRRARRASAGSSPRATPGPASTSTWSSSTRTPRRRRDDHLLPQRGGPVIKTLDVPAASRVAVAVHDTARASAATSGQRPRRDHQQRRHRRRAADVLHYTRWRLDGGHTVMGFVP